jgi:transketolase
LVTGPLGRGLAFAIDFAVALRTTLAQRRRRA